MRHSHIAFAAHMGAAGGISGDLTGDAFVSLARRAPRLLDYLRQHQFPPAETLARHHATLEGKRFPWPSLRDAPEETQVYFVAFRAVAEALNPFHQPDEENARESQEATQHAAGEGAAAQGAAVSAPAAAEAADAGELVEIRVVFQQRGDGPELTFVEVEDVAGNSIRAGTWRGFDGSGHQSLAFTVHKSDIHDPEEQPVKHDQDDVASRTEAGQEAVDTAIAESGGTFSAPEQPAQEKPAEAKKKAGKAK